MYKPFTATSWTLSRWTSAPLALAWAALLLATLPGRAWAIDIPALPPVPDREWAWMGGAATVWQAGVYGEQGVAHGDNWPGARSAPSSWTGADGALWLFGGWGMDSAGHDERLNDLWRYDPDAGLWTWMKGAATASGEADVLPGVHGVLGEAHPANTPGARGGAVTWTGVDGALWLFGGYGRDGAGAWGTLNDLWKYDPDSGNWTWMKGSAGADAIAVASEQGVADGANTPGASSGAIGWTDSDGAFWLFGGFGRDSAGGWGNLNTLWKYEVEHNTWTWVKGPAAANTAAVYGEAGVADAANSPAGLSRSATWQDAEGSVWLFGGGMLSFQTASWNQFNDLWKYDPSANTWTWLQGPTVQNQPGVYGQPGAGDPANLPGARWQAVAWSDGDGGFWLFGGFGRDSAGGMGMLNDLWRYDRITGVWTWAHGDDIVWASGVYGEPGVSDPANIPGARNSGVVWADGDDGLWLFGGMGRDGSGGQGRLNDLWRWDAATTTTPESPTPTPTVTDSPGPTPLPDTDGDGKPDICEFVQPGPPESGQTHLLLPDSDSDGLLDGQEDMGDCPDVITIMPLTDPRNPDTDGDGILDGIEVLFLQTDPTDPNDPPDGTDSSGDGMPDSLAIALGLDPDLPDSDGDGFTDAYELLMGSDPLDADSAPTLGDVNGDGLTNNLDAVHLIRYLLDAMDTPARLDRADVRADGQINNLDAVVLFNWLLGNTAFIPMR